MKQALRDSGLLVHNDLFVNKIIYSFATGLYTLQTMGSDGGCRRKVATGQKSEGRPKKPEEIEWIFGKSQGVI